MPDQAERHGEVSAEAVERACAAYVEARFDLHHDIKPTDSERVGMRAALEASGAVFLTDDEWKALREAAGVQPYSARALRSAREKLS